MVFQLKLLKITNSLNKNYCMITNVMSRVFNIHTYMGMAQFLTNAGFPL